jgi:hypothetical protein
MVVVEADGTKRATWMKPILYRVFWALAAFAYGVAAMIAFIVLLPAALIQSAFANKATVEDRERYLDE